MRRAGLAMLIGCWLSLGGSLSAQTSFSFSYGTGWPVYGAWGTPYPYQVPYGFGGPFYPGPIILPPLVIPAETMYGPQAMQRFMGIDGVRTGVPPVIIANRATPGGIAAAKRRARVSNAAMRAQAATFMGFGDANFDKQDYNAALQRYRTAAESAPDMSEPYLRQSLALVAMGRYESAAKAMRRSLLIEGDPGRLDLRLDKLYADNPVAKTAHLEALARAVEQNPQSADLLLLLGMQLFLDGKADRAIPVFRRCDQLGGNEDGAITGFLPPPAKPAELGRET